MKYWPGTNIPKSKGNAFDWRNSVSKIATSKEFKMSQASTIQMAGKGSDPKKQFTVYSRAGK